MDGTFDSWWKWNYPEEHDAILSGLFPHHSESKIGLASRAALKMRAAAEAAWNERGRLLEEK